MVFEMDFLKASRMATMLAATSGTFPVMPVSSKYLKIDDDEDDHKPLIKFHMHSHLMTS